MVTDLAELERQSPKSSPATWHNPPKAQYLVAPGSPGHRNEGPVGRLHKKQVDPKELPSPALPREDSSSVGVSSGEDQAAWEMPGQMEGGDHTEN